MKFLCDQMLAHLAKWLRAAGYDTTIAPAEAPDSEVLAEALAQGRVLITSDHHFIGKGDNVVFLRDATPAALNAALAIDWLHEPFTRCLLCNTPFREPTPEAIEAQVPADARENSTQFWYCPKCDKVYWEGSHTEAMLKTLASYAAEGDRENE